MQIVNLFLSRPSVYTLPGTWEKQPLIPHGHLGPGAGFALFLGLCLLSLVVYGIYMTFGSGGKSLKDEIKEHARLHELGIAHGHEGGEDRFNLSKKAMEKDYPQHKHN